MSNLEGTGEVDRALALGATTFLVKMNYTLDEVVAKIKEVMGAHEGDNVTHTNQDRDDLRVS